MTSHNPAGYYGLKIPESVETEITSLHYFELAHLLYSLSYSTCPDHFDSERPSRNQLTNRAIEWIADLGEADLIALVRWVASRLAWFHHPSS